MSESENPGNMIDHVELLRASAASYKERFEKERILLSFNDYLGEVAKDPTAQVRDTARYVRDCFLHYGTEEVYRPYGAYTRFKYRSQKMKVCIRIRGTLSRKLST